MVNLAIELSRVLCQLKYRAGSVRLLGNEKVKIFPEAAIPPRDWDHVSHYVARPDDIGR